MTATLERPVDIQTINPPLTPRPAERTQGPRRRGWGLPTAASLALGAVAGGAALLLGTGAPASATVTGAERAAVQQATQVRLASNDFTRRQIVDTPEGPRIQWQVAGVGLVQFAPANHTVSEVVWSARLFGQSGPLVAPAAALQTATSTAAAQMTGFDALTLRSSELIDHGAWAEYLVRYQQRTSNAWLPLSITVGVNARTGDVAYWAKRLDTYTGLTRPTVTAPQATAAVTQTAIRGSVIGAPSLEVVNDGTGDVLAWTMSVSPPAPKGLHVSRNALVAVDAQTGRVSVLGQAQ